MKFFSNSVLVGIFSTGAVLLFLGFLIFTGEISRFGEKNEKFVLVFDENVFGLNEGGKVTLNGIRVGRVKRFFLGENLEQGPVPVLIEINRKLIQSYGIEGDNLLFDTEGKIRNEVLPNLVGQLVQESFVTGILYINLTTEIVARDSNGSVPMLYGYRMLKTKDSIFAELSETINIQKLSTQLSDFVDIATKQMNALDMKSLSDNYIQLAKDLDHLVNSFSQNYSGLGPELGLAIKEARTSFKKISELNDRVDEVLSPQSDLRFSAVSALREVTSMSKSIQAFADMLERNPQALLRGKNISDE